MFRSSGLSRQAFAREHGLKLSSLNRWLAKVNTLPASNSKPLVFTEVNLAGAAPLPAHSWAMEILTPAGLLVRVR